MRLFVAVTPPPEALAHLVAAAQTLRPLGGDDVRWPPPERWHVTLAFLGEVPEQRVATLHAALGEALGPCTPVALALRGGGSFGRGILWVGVEGDLPVLERAARAAARAARAARVPVERRPFRPHLTLARSKGRGDVRDVVAALREYVGPPWTAVQAELVRSRLGARPQHDVVAVLPFGGGG